MDTIFINSGNSKTSDLHRILLNLSGEINLKRSDKKCRSIKSYHVLWENRRKSYKNNKFKISGSKRNEKFELPH